MNDKPSSYGRSNTVVVFDKQDNVELITRLNSVNLTGYVYPSYWGFRIYWDIKVEFGANEYANPVLKEIGFENDFWFGTEGAFGIDYPKLEHLLTNAIWIGQGALGSDPGQFLAFWINESTWIKSQSVRWLNGEIVIRAYTEEDIHFVARCENCKVVFHWESPFEGVAAAIEKCFRKYGTRQLTQGKNWYGDTRHFETFELSGWDPVKAFTFENLAARVRSLKSNGLTSGEIAKTLNKEELLTEAGGKWNLAEVTEFLSRLRRDDM